MKLDLYLGPAESIALRRMAAEFGISDINEAAAFALRDWLIAHGYVEPPHDLDEDTETEGEA